MGVSTPLSLTPITYAKLSRHSPLLGTAKGQGADATAKGQRADATFHNWQG